ncbi:MAG: hypothetical protein ABIR80_12545, partial [Opitutaceae bacterium]
MKRRFFLFLVSTFSLALVGFAADPIAVPFKVTSQQFESGDSIVIQEVIATSPRLKVGDTVVVRGQYQLHSKPKAALGFFLTSKGPSGPGPISPKQQLAIEEGAGSFELVHVVPAEGYLHVSFYPRPSGSSFGGV